MPRDRDRELTPEEFRRISEEIAKEIGKHPPGRTWPSISDVMYGPKLRCVYFVQEGEDGPIKIGWTDRPKRRLFQLQMGNPRPLRFIALMEGGPAEEKRLHKTFAACRLRGEWFRPTAELVNFINNLPRPEK